MAWGKKIIIHFFIIFLLPTTLAHAWLLGGIGCTNSAMSQCFIAGNDNDTFFLLKRNAEEYWESISIENTPSYYLGQFMGLKCTGKDEHDICVAYGAFWKGNDDLLLIQSRDAGKNWEVVHNIPELNSGYFFNVSCSKNNPLVTNICIAVGFNYHPDEPIIVQTIDNGKSWKKISIADLPTVDGAFYSSSCVGKGKKSICVAVGHTSNDFVKHHSLITYTTNAGRTWSLANNIPKTAENATLRNIHCRKAKGKAICNIIGNSDNTKPVLLHTNDSGANWVSKSINGLPLNAHGYLDNIVCNKNDNGSFCVAVGTIDGNLLFIQSPDGGKNWSVKQNPDDNRFHGVSPRKAICNGSFCLVLGYKKINDHPPILVPIAFHSTDSGNNWQVSYFGNEKGQTFKDAYCEHKKGHILCKVIGENIIMNNVDGIKWTRETIIKS